MSFIRRLMAVGRTAFGDRRAMKVIFVPHCILNQNARVAGAAERPAAVNELITDLMKRDIGIIQMPCPELVILGLDRAHLAIRRELEKPEGRSELRKLVKELIQQVQQYRRCGVQVLGVLGKNGSPTCGVEETWYQGVTPGEGVFIEELKRGLLDTNVELRLSGCRDSDPEAALAIVDRWIP